MKPENLYEKVIDNSFSEKKTENISKNVQQFTEEFDKLTNEFKRVFSWNNIF